MIVVADTSVLLNLALVGQIELLPTLFGRVLIPEAVHSEFERLAASSGRFTGLKLPTWVQTHPLTHPQASEEMRKRLDPGESEAICLAIELNADAVLMDESEGRSIAQARGLRTIGILGILIEARRKGLLLAIAPVIDDLRMKAKFRLADSLVNQVLATLGEV
jgi:uncharacterized protein